MAVKMLPFKNYDSDPSIDFHSLDRVKFKPYKIYADNIYYKALDQFFSAMRQPYVIQGALMPDVHAGYSIPIGTVIATQGMIVPSWVGYDIGCGMCAIRTSFQKEEIQENAQEIYQTLYKRIPTGKDHNPESVDWRNYRSHPKSRFLEGLYNDSQAGRQIGTLGGGNHFIEIGFDTGNQVWVVIHSGSRNLGYRVAAYYMAIAADWPKAKEGHYALPTKSEFGANYIRDMMFCIDFAKQNRKEILDRVLLTLAEFSSFGRPAWKTLINKSHNHAMYYDGMWIHRKGATDAVADTFGVIPGNMQDGSFIVRGLGNPDSLYSSSHGAGRVLSRSEAKKSLSINEFKNDMKGIVAPVLPETLDESPRAYKNIHQVIAQQKELVQVIDHIKPMIVIKGRQ